MDWTPVDVIAWWRRHQLIQPAVVWSDGVKMALRLGELLGLGTGKAAHSLAVLSLPRGGPGGSRLLPPPLMPPLPRPGVSPLPGLREGTPSCLHFHAALRMHPFP